LKINDYKMNEHNDSVIDFINAEHSLEHIMPQKIKNDWAFIEDSKVYSEYLHSLGNMTLVGKGYNSEISNRNYAQKKNYYKYSTYLITRDVADKYSCWADESVLNEGRLKAIEKMFKKRTKHLTEIALKALKWDEEL
jgi:hypothetical protein